MNGRRAWFAYAAVLTAVGTVVYSPTLGSWFVGDDIEEIWGARYGGPYATVNIHPGRNFRPVVRGTLEATHRLVGFDPLAYHLSGLAVHVTVSVLVALLARRLLATVSVPVTAAGRRWLPWTAGALFLLWPNHGEAVASISARGDAIVAGLLVASLLCILRPHPPVLVRIAGPLVFAIALLTKETPIGFPVVATLVLASADVGAGPTRRRLLTGVRAAWPYYGVVAAYLLVRRLALGTVKSGSYLDEFVGDSVPRLVLRSGALLVRAVLPGMGPVWWAVAGIVAVAAITCAWLRRHDLPAVPRLPAWTAAAAVIGFLPAARLGASATGPGGERFVYFSSVFVAIGVAWLLWFAFAARERRLVATTFVAIAAAASLIATNTRWTDSGVVAGRFAEELGRLEVDRPAIVLALPDNVRGANTMRNAAGPTVVAVHGWRQPPQLTQLASWAGVARADRVRLRRTGERTWQLQLLEPGARFLPGDTADSGATTAILLSETVLEVTVGPGVDLDDVWYPSGGRLRRLPSTG